MTTCDQMKKLINAKFYTNAAEAGELLVLFAATKQITPSEYTDLMLLVEGVYNPAPVEPTPEPTPEPDPAPPVE